MPQLRAVTYNVRYFGHGTRGLAAQDRRLGRVARALASLTDPPDLLCLQEIETHSVRADIGRRRLDPGEPPKSQFLRFVESFHEALRARGDQRSYQHFYYPAHQYRIGRRRNLYTTGLGVLATNDWSVASHNAHAPFDITHRRIQKLARFKQTRVCAHVRLAHPSGLTLDVFNTHLSLPAFLTKDFWTQNRRLGYGRNQLAEVDRLMQFVSETATPNSARLIVGDFNSLPGSPVHRALTERFGLRDAFREHHADRAFGSRDYPTAGALGLKMPIDYMFSCEGIQWLDFESTHRYGGPGDFQGLSDHVPLVARLRLTPSPEQVATAA